MSNTIFKDFAPAYWAAGVPVIPLYVRNKRPAIESWQAFADCMPGVEQQRDWLSRYPSGNMGLPLGKQSGLVAIDIDTDDTEIIDIVKSVCGPSPWCRVGRKGMVMVYRFNGHKTARIKNAEGQTLVELLSSRTQVVLPPSIHPDTGEPYTANVDLLELIVGKKIPTLPTNIEMALREALQDHGVKLSTTGYSGFADFTPAGSRDTKMTAFAGVLARDVTRGTLKLVEAFHQMDAWWENFQERVVGDEVDLTKGRSKICEFIFRDVNGKKRPLPKGWDDGLTEEDKQKLGLYFDADAEEWDVEQIKGFMLAEFERHDRDSHGRREVIHQVLAKIHRSPSLTTLDVDHILSWISKTTPHNSVPSLRKQLKELNQGELLGLDHTEVARAVLTEMNQYGEMRFHQEKFWQWGGSHWEVRTATDILTFIAEHYGSGLAATKRQSDHKGIMSVMAALAAKPLRLTNTRTEGVNFANGYLDSDGNLIEHDMRFGSTYTLPYRYMPELAGRAARFEAYLHQCWGGDKDYEEKLKALQEAICVTIFGLGPLFQRAILLYGVPHSGKSVLLEIVESLLPEEAKAVVSPSEWADKFLPEMMAGKLLNIAGELSGDKYIDGERFKKIIVGEPMTVQRKNGQPYEMRPNCCHWFGSNHLPRTRDKSAAFNRRWLILTFNRPCPDDQIDRNLALKIVAEERESIVAWAIEALPRLNARNTYTLPQSHQFLVKEMARNNNSVRFFMTESGMARVVPAGSEGKTTAAISEDTLYRAYYSCCFGPASARPVTPGVFRQLMRELQPELRFEMVEGENETGGTTVAYKFITLAGNPASLK
jgi:P4 family phage/plasmid primase-like protien